MFDTHCHLNLNFFEGRVDRVIEKAHQLGVDYFLVAGVDFKTSKKALMMAEKHKGVYAAVGIHPAYIYQYKKLKIEKDLKKIESLINNKKVVAVGEIGLDKYIHQKARNKNYQVDEKFIDLQKLFFIEQLKLAKKHQKAVIIHNRQAKKNLLNILLKIENWKLRMVFHCCQPDDDLLNFAIRNKIFIGVDGDITYNIKKQEFIKRIPLDLLVLETDSPFLKPRITSLTQSDKNILLEKELNEPKNLLLIGECVSRLLKLSVEDVRKKTLENAKKLFDISI